MTEVSLEAGWPLALALLVSWPLVLALAAFLGWLRPALQLILGLPVLLAATGVSFLAALKHPEAPFSLALGGWASPLGIQWLLDQPAAWLLLTVNWISGLASLAAWLMGRSLGGSNYFWPLWWLLWGGMNALVISADLFNLYVTLELMTLAAVGLVAQSRNDPEGKAAMDYLMASLLASLLYLLGVALIYGQLGVLDLRLLQEEVTENLLTALAAVLMTLGLLLKAAAVPLHFWLPRAHSRAQAPVSVLLSSLVVALSIYLLWRLWFGPFFIFLPTVSGLFAVLAAACLVWGGVQALIQTRLKLVLAYSTLSQLGFALMLLALVPAAEEIIWDSLQGQGALMFLLAHGLAKAALFMAAGALVLVYSQDELGRLKGSLARLPLAWVAIALASISLLGAPPTAGFVGKWQLLQATLSLQAYWMSAFLLLGTLMTAVYLFRVMQVAWTIQQTPETSPVHWRAQGLAGLALLTAVSSWVLGGIWLAVQPGALIAPLALDALSWPLFWPVMLIWPLAWWLAKAWQASRQVLTLLVLGWLLNLLLIFAQDLLVFYIAFALLSFLGWWLVIQSAQPQALAAGRIYLGMSLIGELAFFSALGLLSGYELAWTQLHEQPLPGMALLLLGLAFAIKAGVLGVHFWLPLAHPVAPTPASALLSGLMIKAGVLGYLRIFPQQPELFFWGELLVFLGWAAAFYAVLRGLLQSNPKALLAWSSVSQMGLMTLLLGGLLLVPEDQSLLTLSLLLLVVTHALAKAALFLGVELLKRASGRQKYGVLGGLLLAAVTLVGVPLTSGWLVKTGLEASVEVIGWSSDWLLLSSLATATLLGRLLVLLYRQARETRVESAQQPSWAVPLWWLLVLTAAGFAGLWPQEQLYVDWLSPASWGKAWLPVLLASLLLWLGFAKPLRWPASPLTGLRLQLRGASLRPAFLTQLEAQMQNWSSVGLLMAGVAATFASLLAYSLLG